MGKPLGGFIAYGKPLNQITAANARDWLLKVPTRPRLIKAGTEAFNQPKVVTTTAPAPPTQREIIRDPKAAWRRVFKEDQNVRGKTEFQAVS